MKIINDPQEMQQVALEFKRSGKTIGFVPTMGYLHAGHMSLVKQAKEKAEIVIVSIFVNPTQFGPNEDLDKYPRDFENDHLLCQEAGVDIIFYPTPENMYNSNHSTWVEETNLTNSLCGLSRPGHFRGVTTVVTKLFNIVLPDVAVFGQKDAQQALVIKRMINDLNFPIKMIISPIVREQDGLALSSRNRYLSEDERKRAIIISQSLREAKDQCHEINADLDAVKNDIIKKIEHAGGIIDYVELVYCETMSKVTELSSENQCFIAVAAYFGKTRLIDNIFINL